MRILLIPLVSMALLAAAEPDPTAVVVATGVQTYRVKDLDALMAIARRHAGATLAGADDERLRQAIVASLTAREAFLGALAELPLSGPARDRFVLDLLDYRAERSASEPLPAAPAAPTTPADPSAVAGQVVVALPALTLPLSLIHI
jgi:hypothetical protein